MAKKYCKKSSIQAVADEVKTRAGISQATPMAFGDIDDTIVGLVIPTARGAPSTVLTASNPSTTIQRGKYTGGSVSVVPQNATATLSQNGGYVQVESGKTLASVTVPAKNTAQVVTGTFKPSSNATSVTIADQAITFTPQGVYLALAVGVSGTERTSPKFLIGYFTADGTVVGITGYNSSGTPKYYGRVTSLTADFGNGYVTLSNISTNRNGITETANFHNKDYAYIVWG